MSLTEHAASAAIHARMLRNMLSWLDKAQAHADAQGQDSTELLGLRLAPDMLPFAQQVAIACEMAKITLARLAQLDLPAFTGSTDTLAGLRARVEAAISLVDGVSADQVAGRSTAEVVLPQRQGAPLHFTGETFLQQWALPNFFFHVTTTYALLRHAGVNLGKADYLGAV